MVINHGRCCCLCGRCNSHWVNCLYLFVVLYLFIYFILLHSLLFSFFIYLVFILSSELLSRTSSHTCGRWYLPTFLFRDGLLTLFYIDSFMNLMRIWSLWSSMPFLDTLVIPQSEGGLMTTIYRKSTHTDQYLQLDSHHAISVQIQCY